VLGSLEEAKTVGDDGHRRIRRDIIFGTLPPEHKLRLEAMRGDYGLSISTLREILSRLSADGLVIAEGRRGFEVAPVSAQDLKGLLSCVSFWNRMLWSNHSRAAILNGRSRRVSAL
jgi:GntR family transcriptional regulator, carbon starvation induced regulator